MSRQSKNAVKRKIAEGFSLQRKSGSSGPATTQAKHGKSPARRHYSVSSRTAPLKSRDVR